MRDWMTNGREKPKTDNLNLSPILIFRPTLHRIYCISVTLLFCLNQNKHSSQNLIFLVKLNPFLRKTCKKDSLVFAKLKAKDITLT